MTELNRKTMLIINKDSPDDLLQLYLESWDFAKNMLDESNNRISTSDKLLFKRLNAVLDYVIAKKIDSAAWNLDIDKKGNETTHFRFRNEQNNDVFEIFCDEKTEETFNLIPVYVSPFSHVIEVKTIEESILGFREEHPLAQK